MLTPISPRPLAPQGGPAAEEVLPLVTKESGEEDLHGRHPTKA